MGRKVVSVVSKNLASELEKAVKASKGIVSTNIFKEFLLEQLLKEKNKWADIPSVAQQYFDDPKQAIKALKGGSAMFRGTPIETYGLCGMIYEEIQNRLKNKKLVKTDPGCAALNRVINDLLPILCAYIKQDYKKVKPSNTDLKRNPKLLKPEMTITRQIIINQCIERYRRLVMRDKKKFITWYNSQPHTKHQQQLGRLIIKKLLM